jgi:DNA adenine methylase
MSAPARPLLRWLGGKYRLAEWIVGQMPAHDIYLEPFGGAASVLFRKPRAYNEVLSDLDDELVNLYRVLREPDCAAELIRRLELTPYAEAEYLLALKPVHGADQVERAARLVVRSHMAHGSNGARTDRPAGFRSDGRSGTTNVAGEWASFPSAMWAMVERLRGVTIRRDPAKLLIDEYRDQKVLIYLDPPYMPETRSTKARQREGYHAYSYEMTVEDHQALLDQIADHPAQIMLSGYDTALYRERLRGWQVRTKRARAHRNSPRTELLWLNPLAASRLDAGPLFPSRSTDQSQPRPQIADLGDSTPQLFRPTVHSEREG